MRKTFATINTAALKHNLDIAQFLAQHSNQLPVIKANAYGHGLVEVGKFLSQHCKALAVAIIDEAIELRDAGVTIPILVLEGCLRIDEFQYAVKHNLWLMVNSFEQLCLAVNSPTKHPITLWLKMDCGIHRMGILPNQIVNAYQTLVQCPHVNAVVLAGHLTHATNADIIARQYNLINRITAPHKSLANSAAILQQVATKYTWCRPGIMLYGASPLDTENNNNLQPVMQLESEIIAIRNINEGETVGYEGIWTASQPSTIATIAIGYGDGYPRFATSKTPVWVKGREAFVAGAVSMDMITVDVTHIPNAQVGDTAELWGTNLAVNKVAQSINTISHDCLTGITARVPRIYQYG